MCASGSHKAPKPKPLPTPPPVPGSPGSGGSTPQNNPNAGSIPAGAAAVLYNVPTLKVGGTWQTKPEELRPGMYPNDIPSAWQKANTKKAQPGTNQPGFNPYAGPDANMLIDPNSGTGGQGGSGPTPKSIAKLTGIPLFTADTANALQLTPLTLDQRPGAVKPVNFSSLRDNLSLPVPGK